MIGAFLKKKNIDSICSIGRSSKKGNQQCGYIGEKGMPNSVLLTSSKALLSLKNLGASLLARLFF